MALLCDDIIHYITKHIYFHVYYTLSVLEFLSQSIAVELWNAPLQLNKFTACALYAYFSTSLKLGGTHSEKKPQQYVKKLCKSIPGMRVGPHGGYCREIRHRAWQIETGSW